MNNHDKYGGIDMGEKPFNRWLVVISGLVVMLMLGVTYAWGVFLKPLMGEFGWAKAETSLAFSILLLVFAIIMIPAGRLQDKKGPRVVATIGGLLLGGGFILASFTNSLSVLYTTYGIIAGAGIACAYVTPIATGVKWFPDKRGLVTGLIVCGFGAGSAFLAPLASHIIYTMGWRMAYVILGVLFLIAVTVAAQLLRNPPEGYTPEGWKPSTSQNQPNVHTTYDYDLLEMIKTPQFWMLWIMFAFTATAGLMVIGHVVAFAIESGIDKMAAAFALTVLAIFNGAGRVASGIISDKIGRTKTMLVVFVIQAIMLSMLIKMTSVATIYAAVAVIGFCFGADFTLFPAATADFYGTKNIGVNYGAVFTSYGVAGLLGPFLGGYVFDVTQSYYLAFQAAGVLCAIAAIVSLIVKPMGVKEVALIEKEVV